MPDPRPTDDAPASPRARPIARVMVVVLGLVVVLLLARSALRVPDTSRDGLMLHTSSAMWVQGENPYDQSLYKPRMAEALGDPERVPKSGVSLYLPSTYLLLSPWGLLDWPVAKWVMAGVSWVSIGVLGWCLFRLAGDGRGLGEARGVCGVSGPWWCGGVAMVLLVGLWTPVHTTIAMGHICVLVTAMLAGGALALREGRVWLAAVLLALATAVKPMVGGLLVFLLLMRGEWRGFALCCVVGLASLALGAWRLSLAGVDWFPAWQQNVEMFSRSGSANPQLGSDQRLGMLGVSLIVHALTDHRAIASAAGWLVVLVAAVLAWKRDHPARRGRGPGGGGDALWLPAVLATATMLAGYHRYYDAVLLLLPMAWVLSRWRGLPGGVVRWGVLLGLALFAVVPNTQAALVVLVERRSPGVMDNALWGLTLQTHQTWVILAVLAGLLWLGPVRGRGVASESTRRFADSASA